MPISKVKQGMRHVNISNNPVSFNEEKLYTISIQMRTAKSWCDVDFNVIIYFMCYILLFVIHVVICHSWLFWFFDKLQLFLHNVVWQYLLLFYKYIVYFGVSYHRNSRLWITNDKGAR